MNTDDCFDNDSDFLMVTHYEDHYEKDNDSNVTDHYDNNGSLMILITLMMMISMIIIENKLGTGYDWLRGMWFIV